MEHTQDFLNKIQYLSDRERELNRGAYFVEVEKDLVKRNKMTGIQVEVFIQVEFTRKKDNQLVGIHTSGFEFTEEEFNKFKIEDVDTALDDLGESLINYELNKMILKDKLINTVK